MIIMTDRFDVVPGRMEEALVWADKTRTVSKKAGFVGERNWLLRSINNTHRFTMATQFSSLAEFEEKAKSVADPSVQILVRELATEGWLAGTERTFARILKAE
jgi:hypothetical protein